MNTYDRIKSDIVQAMKSKDSEKLLVLRSLDSSIKNFAIAACHKDGPTEEDVVSAITQGIKRGTDSAEQFKVGCREDLVASELFQVNILRNYLPEQMSKESLVESLSKDVLEYSSTNGQTTQKDFGKLMKIVIPKYKGIAESKDIQEILKTLLTNS